jgi:hypothetical protein
MTAAAGGDGHKLRRRRRFLGVPQRGPAGAVGDLPEHFPLCHLGGRDEPDAEPRQPGPPPGGVERRAPRSGGGERRRAKPARPPARLPAWARCTTRRATRRARRRLLRRRRTRLHLLLGGQRGAGRHSVVYHRGYEHLGAAAGRSGHAHRPARPSRRARTGRAAQPLPLRPGPRAHGARPPLFRDVTRGTNDLLGIGCCRARGNFDEATAGARSTCGGSRPVFSALRPAPIGAR